MSETPDKTTQITPVNQAIPRAGKGGIVPPVHSRWKPGQSGHPQGRPPAGATIRQWLNVMQEWPADKLRKVIDDPKAPASKIVAARVWMDASSTAGNDFDRIMDRTDGKPKQAIDMRMDATLTQGDAIHAAMEKLLSDPEAFAAAEVIAKRLDSDAS